MRALVGALAVAAMGCGSGPAAATKDGEWSCGAVHGAATAVRALGHGRRLKLGAVADTNGTAPATLANLRRFAGVFSVEHVDAVVALGDLGATEDEIATVLTALAGAKVPLLALAGEREPENAFHAAVVRVRAAGVDIIDLVETRLVDTGKIDILSVPGYPFSDKGCRYTSADLEGARRLVDGRWRPLIVVAHTPPKGAGDKAVDWATGEVNAGDPAMLDLQNAIYPNAALFAHVDEAGGRNERGRINVGGVEAGMATIVELRDGVARTEVLR